jgi:hypothetical protein
VSAGGDIMVSFGGQANDGARRHACTDVGDLTDGYAQRRSCGTTCARSISTSKNADARRPADAIARRGEAIAAVQQDRAGRGGQPAGRVADPARLASSTA